MKQLLQLFLLLLIIPVSCFNVSATTRPAAEVVSISGTGEYRFDEISSWSDAGIGQDLFAGSDVRTGPLSRMGLLFSDRTQIRLNEKTILRVKAIHHPKQKKSKSIIQIDQGRVWTQNRDVPDEFIMETPSATAAIRGTDWDLEVDENGSATITVLNGEVYFFNDFGQVVVKKNEQAHSEIGRAPVKRIIIRPADRVQWVTAYAVNPLRHISFCSGNLKELKTALEELKRMPKGDGIHRGYIEMTLAQREDAETSFKTALLKDADNFQALIGLGYLALHRQQPVEAAGYFNQAEALSAETELLTLGQIAVNIQEQDLIQAIRRLDDLIRIPLLDQPAAYLILSDLMIYGGDIQEAIRLTEEALKKFPDHARVYSQMARLYLMQDHPEKSFRYIEHAMSIDTTSYPAKIVQGELAYIQGDAVHAKMAYQEAAALKPADDQAWYGLGVIHSELENVPAARSALEKALDLDPKGPGYEGERGTLETFANNFKEAEKAFNSALEYNPSDYVALTGRGVMLLKKGETEAALNSFLRAGLMEPRYARARMYTAVAYYQLGKISQAVGELEQASIIDDKDPMPYLLASIIYTDLLQPADAIKSARHALKLMPYLKSLNQLANNQRGTTNLGQAFAFMGMEDWSMMYAQESYNPFWAGSHLFLADRYAGLFNKNSALFQGFLSDPVVFGADNRFQTLVSRPGHNLNTSLRGTTSNQFSGVSPLLEISGFDNKIMPAAYYLGYESFDLDFDSGPYKTQTSTIAAGVMPAHPLGIFAFADHSHLKTDFKKTAGGMIFDLEDTLSTDRVDMGVSYKLLPTSRLWLKSGYFRSDDFIEGAIIEPLLNFPQNTEMTVDVRSPEFAFRHTFELDNRHEISWGAETAHREMTVHYEQLDILDSYFLWESWTNDVIHQQYSEKSRDVYISDRFNLNADVLIQVDLFYQQHDRNVRQALEWQFPDFPGLVMPQAPVFNERLTTRHLSPRLGIVYRWDFGKVFRFAWQNWIRPSSQGTLGPVATAGIPLDDRLVSRGGELNRYRGQFDWEISPKTFITTYFDYKKIENNPFSVTMPFSVNELESLKKLRSRDMGALSREDLLEFINTPEYEAGEIRASGISFNHLLTGQWGLSGKYIHTSSENTGLSYKGNDVPYLPEHTATMGATFVHPDGWYFAGRLVYRSVRYTDAANFNALNSCLNGAFDIYWQSPEKHWIFRFSVDEAFDRNQAAQYTAEITFKY